jgi:protein-lysine N-methyltransferase EEF2KMT
MPAYPEQVNTSPLLRFCRQYRQCEDVLDYPEPAYLRDWSFQDEIHRELFAEDALKYATPPRYQVRVLKELLSRIEASITDWDEHVGRHITDCT